MKKVVLCFVFLFLSTLSLNVISESAYATNFMTLHSFAGGAGDGEAPYGSLVLSRDGTTLYGMTDFGGSSSKGTIFCIPTIGGTLTVLHSFTGGASDGQWPGGNLTFSEDGTTLYGMTIAGGSVSSGTIFKIRTDGTGFELLHTFTDSEYPEGSLILCNSVLYGMASGGGDHDLGVIFKINTDGTGFTTLHSFSGDTSDGSSPHGSLTISGTTLYGMTYRGGELNMGVVLK